MFVSEAMDAAPTRKTTNMPAPKKPTPAPKTDREALTALQAAALAYLRSGDEATRHALAEALGVEA